MLLSSAALHTAFVSNFLISQFPFSVSPPKPALFRIGFDVTAPLVLGLERPVPSLAGKPSYSAKPHHNKHSSSEVRQ